MPSISRRIAALLSISWLAGCASTESVVPQDAPTMRETYDRHFEALRGGGSPLPDRSGLERGLEDGSAALAGYTPSPRTGRSMRFSRGCRTRRW